MLLTQVNQRRKKRVFGIPQNEMVVLAGDMNGHVGSSNAGYDGTHGGFGYGDRNADGFSLLTTIALFLFLIIIFVL